MPNGYESPLNKLADALPGVIMQMQDMKLRQETQEAMNSYRQSMLAQTIRMNDLRQDALRAAEELRGPERGREERETLFEARSKYGEPGARSLYPGLMEQYYPQGMPPEKVVAEKGPTASTTARYYSARDKFQKEIDEANERIESLRGRLKLAPGEKPVTPAWPGKGKEQTDLDNWNKLEGQLDTATASLDSLHKRATEEGVDLTIGARAELPTPEEVSGMSEDEILQRLVPGIE